MNFIKDKYWKKRGSFSRIYKIYCVCGNYWITYQKDGPGHLKRVYVDRISNWKNTIICKKCKLVFGYKIHYKEKRETYRIYRRKIVMKEIYDSRKMDRG